jgi:hypothetical protein
MTALDGILRISREILAKPEVGVDDDLAEHGGTSLSIVRIVAVTSQTLALDIDLSAVSAPISVRKMANAARVLEA